jgi:ligand-binding sensor domain-containing protein
MKNFLFFSLFLTAIVYLPFKKTEKLYNKPEYVRYTKNVIENETKLHVNLLNAGNPFITNYDLNLDVNDQVWSIIQDSEGAMLFGSNKGFIVFDGREQTLIKMSHEPLVMAHISNSGRILVGCDNDYGYLEKDEKGLYTYKSLSSKELHPGTITNIEQTNNAIYFYSRTALIQFSKAKLTYKNSWYAEKKELFDGIIKLKNQVYLKVKDKGLYKTEDTHKKKLVIRNKILSSSGILFNLPFSDKKTLIGTDDNKLYLFNGSKFKSYRFDFESYLSENQLINGCNLKDSLFALSTISGGAIIVNKYTGKAEYTINYQTGLPDDEIFAVGKDLNGALWLSHAYGISRVNYNLPVYDFKAYPGIEGRLIDVQKFDSTIYVATTQGLFYLDTLSSLKEKEVYVKKKIRIKNKQQQKKEVVVEPAVNEAVKSEKKKSFFEKRQERKKKRWLKKQRVKGIVTDEPVKNKSLINIS